MTTDISQTVQDKAYFQDITQEIREKAKEFLGHHDYKKISQQLLSAISTALLQDPKSNINDIAICFDGNFKTQE